MLEVGAVGWARGALGESFELVPVHEVRGDAWRVPFAPHAVASWLLQRLRDPREAGKVRALARTYAGFGAGDDQEVVWGLVRALEFGQLAVIRGEPRPWYGAEIAGPRKAEPDEADAGEAAPDTGAHWVALRVVDDESAEPVADLELVVVLPDHSEHTVKTDSGGRVELRSPEGGSCDVRTECEGEYFTLCVTFVGFGRAVRREEAATAVRGPVPRGRRARVEGTRSLHDVVEYRVRDGDTWESIAEAHGVAAEALMRFNFDTADPGEIQVAMSEHLGCWRRDPDSGRLVFTSDDEPGILLVPRPWQRSVSTGYEHHLRVRGLRAPARPYLFSV